MFDLKQELDKRDWKNENLTFNQKVFFYWISERNQIWHKRNKGQLKPWTQDSIFQRYKFTNVEREKDVVSIWIKKNWIDPYKDHPNLWFAMIIARLFNWPPTLERIGFPEFRPNGQTPSSNAIFTFLDWKHSARIQLKAIRDDEKGKIFTGAYLVSTNGVKMDKIDYILDRVLTPIWERGCSPQHLGESTGNWLLEEYWKFLIQFDGLGSFMAGQVVADLKFAPPLENALDWWTWAPLGPGSIRGLNRFFGRDVSKPVKQETGLVEMRQIQKMVENELGTLYPVHNLQNCLCEYYKYCKIYYNEGRTRSRYPGV